MKLEYIPPLAISCEIKGAIERPNRWQEQATAILRSSCFTDCHVMFSPDHEDVIEGLFVNGKSIIDEILADLDESSDN